MKIVEEDPPLEPKYKIPWLIEALLYPMNISGLIHLAIFVFLPFLIQKLSYIDVYCGIVRLFAYLLFFGYFFYYLTLCLVHSSKGFTRAPDITLETPPSIGDLFSQLSIILGCTAICFWPTALYYILTEKTGLFFWIILTLGIFFFPMAFLTGLLFDSFDALNPIALIRSISRTFTHYCVLVLLICIPLYFLHVLFSHIPTIKILRQTFFYLGMLIDYFTGSQFVWYKIGFFYSAMVAAHLVGRFYWKHKDRLDWGL